MVSGSKNKAPKKKEKMVFAKDKNQVIAMVVVLSAFGANTVYLLVKYIQDQMPHANTQNSQLDQNQASQNPDDPKPQNLPGSKTAPGENPQQASTAGTGQNQTPPGAPQTSTGTPQPVAPASPSFPFIPAILILLLVIAAAFAAKKFLNNNNKASSDPRQKNSAKKSAPGKMQFAKDKKQVLTMVVVLALFLGNTVYMVAKSIMDQMPQKPAQNSTQSAEDEMAQQQQQDLKSLNNPNQPNDAGTNNDISVSQDANNIYMQTMNQQGTPGHPGVNDNLKAIQANDSGDVDILVKNKLPQRSSKMVFVSVSNSGRSNPFLPAAENIVPGTMSYLTPPPETALQSSEASKVISTTISGILYDKYNPSAIINIEGSDYLVKTGDVIHNYKILSITKNQVLVQLGKNIYKAGVGELLSETDLNYNVIANLNKKFGGNNVSINVRRNKR